jgi:trimethylamine--corrinoid protein Co-methyltransferase
MRSEWQEKPLQEVFRGSVFLIPPLKLGRHEAFQVQYFREHGLKVPIGSMHSLGGSAPVTIAGVVTLNLAEQLALRILDWAWFGIKKLHLGGSIAVMDMRTTFYRSAPVERPIANLVNAQLARFYGASFSAHGNLTDAKQPTVEAGMQKAMTAVPLFLAGGDIWMPAGLLSADQICSPIQLVFDNELMGSLKRFLNDFDVSDEAIGIDAILDAGAGGQFFDQPHTVRHMRKEIWSPDIWQRTMIQAWVEGGGKNDIDAAYDKIIRLNKEVKVEPDTFLSQSEESQILDLIERARTKLNT